MSTLIQPSFQNNNTPKQSDMEVRKELYNRMYVSGGSTLFRGFSDRILSEIRRELPQSVKCKLHAPPERKYTTWLGGSILANLTAFRKMMVTAARYEVCLFFF